MKIKNKAQNGVFNTVLLAICSFVGVGFITGSEIWFYFARFGGAMISGVLVFCGLLFALSFLSFAINRTKNASFIKLKNKCSLLSELAIASAMISGLFETTKTLFSRMWFIVFLCAILILILLLFFDKGGFVFYNYILTIFLIFVIIKLFLINNDTLTHFSHNKWPLFSFKKITLSIIFAGVYTFSNISEIRSILEINVKNKSKKEKIFLCVTLSLTLSFLIIILSLLLLKNNHITKHSMPFLMFFKQEGGLSLFVFLIGIVMAMISTADACLIGAKEKLDKSKNGEIFNKLLVILISLLFGQIPFNVFIEIIYPLVASVNFLLFFFEIFIFRNKT